MFTPFAAVKRQRHPWGHHYLSPYSADALKGRTLRQLADIGISITFQCSDCEHVAVWPYPWMKRERRLQPLMGQPIDAFAPKRVRDVRRAVLLRAAVHGGGPAGAVITATFGLGAA